jgi:hypothetical protein
MTRVRSRETRTPTLTALNSIDGRPTMAEAGRQPQARGSEGSEPTPSAPSRRAAPRPRAPRAAARSGRCRLADSWRLDRLLGPRDRRFRGPIDDFERRSTDGICGVPGSGTRWEGDRQLDVARGGGEAKALVVAGSGGASKQSWRGRAGVGMVNHVPAGWASPRPHWSERPGGS